MSFEQGTSTPASVGDSTPQNGDAPNKEYALHERLFADACLAAAPIMHPDQVVNGLSQRATEFMNNPVGVGQEMAQGLPVAVGMGVSLALAARSPGRIGQCASWLMKSKGGIATMNVGGAYAMNAGHFVETFNDPSKLQESERALAQSFGSSIADTAAFTAVTLPVAWGASAGLKRLSTRAQLDSAVVRNTDEGVSSLDSAVVRQADEGASTLDSAPPPNDGPPGTGRRSIASEKESLRQKYGEAGRERASVLAEKDWAQFDKFSETAHNGYLDAFRLRQVFDLLDNHYSERFDVYVKGWMRDHPDTPLTESLQKYYANKPVQQQRLELSLQKMLDSESVNVDNPAATNEIATAIHRFKARARQDNLSDESVQQTLRAAHHIRSLGYSEVAVQTLLQAADPLLVIQGRHPTCTLSSLELWTYTKEPHVAVDTVRWLVGQHGRNGTMFDTASGATVTLDGFSMKPERGSLEFINPAARSYASQMFQMLAGNIFHQQSGKGYAFTKKWLADGTYLRRDVVTTEFEGKQVPSTEKTGFSTRRAVPFIAQELGTDQIPRVISGQNFRSFSEFRDFVAGLSKSDFPAIISVDAAPIKQMLPGQPRQAPVVPTETNHAVPLLDVARFGVERRAWFHDNWLFHPNQARREPHEVNLQELWALMNPKLGAHYWNPK